MIEGRSQGPICLYIYMLQAQRATEREGERERERGTENALWLQSQSRVMKAPKRQGQLGCRAFVLQYVFSSPNLFFSFFLVSLVHLTTNLGPGGTVSRL